MYRPPSARATRLQGVFGRESPSGMQLEGIIGAPRGPFEGTPRGPPASPIPVHRGYYHAARRLSQRFHSACKLRPSLGSSRSAMKLVVALALPAAALRPVQVTMSAAQNRRAFVIGGTAAAAAAATKANAYSLPDLPYAYDALEPSIDAATMKFHHGE